jgi:hypothetical protein
MVGDVDPRGDQSATTDTNAVTDLDLDSSPHERVVANFESAARTADAQPNVTLNDTALTKGHPPWPIDPNAAFEQAFGVNVPPSGEAI